MKKFCVQMILAGAAAATLAQATPITVLATSDIWLSGQPGGSSVTGLFGTDTLAANPPVLYSPVTGGQVLMFSATGSTSVDGSCFANADGIGASGYCYANEFSDGTGPINGIGNYTGPADVLYGVFLNSSTPTGTGGPASLDYTVPANISAASYTPALNQIFYIGDGLTGNGTGAVQQFLVPTGATRLYLAVADSVGGSNNNVGSLSVTVTVASAPEPATVGMSAFALLAALAVVRRRRAC